MDGTGKSARIGDVSGTSSGYERSPTFKRQSKTSPYGLTFEGTDVVGGMAFSDCGVGLTSEVGGGRSVTYDARKSSSVYTFLSKGCSLDHPDKFAPPIVPGGAPFSMKSLNCTLGKISIGM
ncbi:hypothetical protein J6590_089303 [Homalodisca vitripennis]|nr:hypothetical protein J6590_089303 [Homalodisca vitripennis]